MCGIDYTLLKKNLGTVNTILQVILRTLTKSKLLGNTWRSTLPADLLRISALNWQKALAFFSEHICIPCLVSGPRLSQKLCKYVDHLKPIRNILLIISQTNGYCGIVQRKLGHCQRERQGSAGQDDIRTRMTYKHLLIRKVLQRSQPLSLTLHFESTQSSAIIKLSWLLVRILLTCVLDAGFAIHT